MKKAIPIAVAVVAGLAIFAVALVLVINLRGGLDASHAGVKKLPLLGAMIKVQQPTAEEKAQHALDPAVKADAAARTNLSYLRFGPQARLAELTDELEARRTEYDSLKQETERRSRELDAWEKQLKVERDALVAKFEKEKVDLAAQRQELDQREKALASQQLKIEDSEAANLKATAAIYDKMAPEQAAAILAQMYSGGQPESVVKIISLMQDRTAAKALEAFPDIKIGAQITEQLQRIAKPTKAGG